MEEEIQKLKEENQALKADNEHLKEKLGACEKELSSEQAKNECLSAEIMTLKLQQYGGESNSTSSPNFDFDIQNTTFHCAYETDETREMSTEELNRAVLVQQFIIQKQQLLEQNTNTTS